LPNLSLKLPNFCFNLLLEGNVKSVIGNYNWKGTKGKARVVGIECSKSVNIGPTTGFTVVTTSNDERGDHIFGKSKRGTMRKLCLAIIAIYFGLLVAGEAHAQRLETNDTNPEVPAGTVYDTSTNLLWEMKTDGGGLHGANNRYAWNGIISSESAFVEFLGALNGAKSNNGATVTGCFASLCDWRLPQIDELRGILLSSSGCSREPCIDPIFGPTQSYAYWSATTNTGDSGKAWYVSFGNGGVSSASKLNLYYVRAVRSGLPLN
jgi:hypothetical protein